MSDNLKLKWKNNNALLKRAISDRVRARGVGWFMLIQSLLIHRCLERAFNLIEADGTEGRKKEGIRGFVPAGFFAQLVRSCADGGGGGWHGGSGGGGPDVSWGRRPPCNTPQATCRAPQPPASQPTNSSSRIRLLAH